MLGQGRRGHSTFVWNVPGNLELGRKPVLPVWAHLHQNKGSVTTGRSVASNELGMSTVPECAHVVVKALRCAPRERDDAKRERGRGCIGLDTPSSTPRFDELLHETGIARPALDESTRPGAAAPAPAAGPCAAFIVALKHVVLAWQSYDTHAIAREQPDPASYWQRWVMRTYLGTTRRP